MAFLKADRYETSKEVACNSLVIVYKVRECSQVRSLVIQIQFYSFVQGRNKDRNSGELAALYGANIVSTIFGRARDVSFLAEGMTSTDTMAVTMPRRCHRYHSSLSIQ